MCPALVTNCRKELLRVPSSGEAGGNNLSHERSATNCGGYGEDGWREEKETTKGGQGGGGPARFPPPIIRKLLKEKMQYVLLYNKKVVVPVVWHCRCRAFEAFTSILIANDKLKITRDTVYCANFVNPGRVYPLQGSPKSSWTDFSQRDSAPPVKCWRLCP